MLLSAIDVKRMSGEIPDYNDLKTKKKGIEFRIPYISVQKNNLNNGRRNKLR